MIVFSGWLSGRCWHAAAAAAGEAAASPWMGCCVRQPNVCEPTATVDVECYPLRWYMLLPVLGGDLCACDPQEGHRAASFIHIYPSPEDWGSWVLSNVFMQNRSFVQPACFSSASSTASTTREGSRLLPAAGWQPTAKPIAFKQQHTKQHTALRGCAGAASAAPHHGCHQLRLQFVSHLGGVGGTFLRGTGGSGSHVLD